MIKVSGEPDLVRDPYSKALLNTNKAALEEHRRRKNLARSNHERVMRLEQDVRCLKQSVGNIEKMLELILEQKESNK